MMMLAALDISGHWCLHCQSGICAGLEMVPAMMCPSTSFRFVADRLDIVAVGVEDECTIVVGVVVWP